MIAVQFKDVTYKAKTYRIAYQIQGTAQRSIFFLHGWGCSKDSFSRAFENVELSKYTLCAFDLVGFGDSDRPSEFSYDLQEQAAVSAAFIGSFEVDNVSLVGHSMGGAVALLCAPMLKSELHVVVSAEGNISSQDAGPISRLLAVLPFGGITLKLVLRLAGLVSKNYRVWAKWCDKASNTAIKRSARSLADWSDSGQLLLRLFQIDAIYMYGTSSSRAKRPVISTLPHTRAIHDAGHIMMLDNSDGFYAAIGEAMAK